MIKVVGILRYLHYSYEYLHWGTSGIASSIIQAPAVVKETQSSDRCGPKKALKEALWQQQDRKLPANFAQVLQTLTRKP